MVLYFFYRIRRIQYKYPSVLVYSFQILQNIYSHDRSAYSAAGKYVDRSWEYLNLLETHKYGNWDSGRAISFLGIHKCDFHCSASNRIMPLRIRREAFDRDKSGVLSPEVSFIYKKSYSQLSS